MRRDEVIQRLKQTEPVLRGFGVAALFLFGSYARDEAKSDSDVDVFVDPVPERDFGFLPFMDAYQTIQEAFGEREAVRIF
jgi:predicted nucleotidyltransferase